MKAYQLEEEASRLASADRQELLALHHAKFPAERPSVRGVYRPTASALLADLIVDLAERYKSNGGTD